MPPVVAFKLTAIGVPFAGSHPPGVGCGEDARGAAAGGEVSPEKVPKAIGVASAQVSLIGVLTGAGPRVTDLTSVDQLGTGST